MATLDIIEYFDDSGKEMAHRLPESGSAETKFGSQLVVQENQTGVFYRDGKCYDELPAGRHTLSTQNIPLLTKLLSKAVGFGEKSPFRTAVMFVGRQVFTDLKWGTKEPIILQDSVFKLARVRAFGKYTVKVVNPILFINTMVGTRGSYTTEDAEGYLKGAVVARLSDLMGEQMDSVVKLPALMDELAAGLKVRVAEDFKKYGMEMLDFFIESISLPEEVQKYIDKASSMGAVGDMNQFMQFQAATAMEEASKSGGGGGAAGAGVGAGAGLGMGFAMAGMMGNAMNQPRPGAPAGGGAPGVAPAVAAGAAAMIACAGCQAPMAAGSKFCPACGAKQPQGVVCPKCGKEAAPGTKFCPECGANLVAAPKCPGCQADVPPGTKFCPNCGAKIG